jgi:hypothetical protein
VSFHVYLQHIIIMVKEDMIQNCEGQVQDMLSLVPIACHPSGDDGHVKILISESLP